MRDAGWRTDWADCVLVTTMTPCWMCAGMMRFLGLGAVAYGDGASWPTDAATGLAAAGIRVIDLGSAEAVAMFDDWLTGAPASWSQPTATGELG